MPEPPKWSSSHLMSALDTILRDADAVERLLERTIPPGPSAVCDAMWTLSTAVTRIAESLAHLATDMVSSSGGLASLSNPSTSALAGGPGAVAPKQKGVDSDGRKDYEVQAAPPMDSPPAAWSEDFDAAMDSLATDEVPRDPLREDEEAVCPSETGY